MLPAQKLSQPRLGDLSPVLSAYPAVSNQQTAKKGEWLYLTIISNYPPSPASSLLGGRQEIIRFSSGAALLLPGYCLSHVPLPISSFFSYYLLLQLKIKR